MDDGKTGDRFSICGLRVLSAVTELRIPRIPFRVLGSVGTDH